MLTGLDGSRMEAILIGSSRSNGVECILVESGEEERRESVRVCESESHKKHENDMTHKTKDHPRN